MREPLRRLVAVPGQIVPLILALTALLPQVALALTSSQVYERVKDSIVVVMAYDRTGKQVGLGSGVVLPSGDIVTNHHVIKAGVRHTVARGGGTTAATVKASDPDKDLCLLRAPGLIATPARLGRATALKVGEPVYAVGAPAGLELSLSEGIVSQLRGGPPPIIQTTVAISPGSSGGGLFNDRGELVGITTFYLEEGQSLNFALPVEWLTRLSRKKIRERPRAEAPAVPGARLKPDDAKAWYNLGVAYQKKGRIQEAIKAYREALRLQPDNAKAWYNLGAAYHNKGRYQEAIKAVREALRLKPDLADAWCNLGLAYFKLGRHREAIEAYRETLRLQPDNAEAWYNLGAAYANSGNRSAALEAVKELRRHDPTLADKLFNLIIKP